MKNKFKYEELLENLPDYINNSLNNNELKEAIQKEIETNTDFKKEFDSTNFIVKRINSFCFTEPPENYFNSLLPVINDKIYKRLDSFNLFKSFSIIWKLAIPLVTIIIFFIGYKTFFQSNEYTNKLANDTQMVSEKNNFVSSVDSVTSQEIPINTKGSIESSKNVSTTKNQKRTESIKKENISLPDDDNKNIIYDIMEGSNEEDMFFLNESEGSMEQEFDKLSVEEQNRIIYRIKNSNL
jgi:hypothetical protein